MEDRFATNAQMRGQNVRLVISAKENVSSYSKKDCLLLVSDSHFEVLYIKLLDAIKSFSWFRLTKIKITGDTLVICFGKVRLTFVSTSMNKFKQTISDILPRILQQTELNSIEYNQLKATISKQNALSCLLRFKERTTAFKQRISSSAMTYMKRFLMFSEPTANLSRISDPMNSIPPVLDALPLYPNLREIIVPLVSRVDSYSKICNFVAEKSSVEHIEVEGPVTRNFDRYLHNIEGNKELSLVGLTFTDSRMTSRNLETLAGTLKQKEIYCLGMKRAISSDATDYFYSNFLSNAIGSKLIYLNLDKTLNPNIKLILEACPRLQMLSLAGCGLDICQAAKELTAKQAGGLRAVNLSNNVCKESTPRSLRISSSIQTIQINSITWSNRTLPEFFQTLTHSIRQGLYLSAADADATTDEWIRLFSYLRQTKFTGLHSLVWCSNPVHNRLFDFLAKNHDLVHLDLSGCFIQQEKEPMVSFTNYLSKTPNLKSLVIRGNSASYIGTYIPNILTAVENAKNIQYLDLCGNRGGNASLDAVRTLINGRSNIEVVSFDGSEPESADALISLLTASLNSVTNAAVSFPQSDIDHLLRRKKITEDQIQRLTQSLTYETNHSTSPFDKPFNVFHDNPPPPFPTYLKEIVSQNNQQNEEDNISEMYTLDNIEIEPPEQYQKIRYVPAAAAPSNVTTNTADDDDEPPTLQTLNEGTRKRRRRSKKSSARQESNLQAEANKSVSSARRKKRSKIEKSTETLESTLESILPESSTNMNTSELGDVETLNEHSTSDAKEDKQSSSSRRKSNVSSPTGSSPKPINEESNSKTSNASTNEKQSQNAKDNTEKQPLQNSQISSSGAEPNPSPKEANSPTISNSTNATEKPEGEPKKKRRSRKKKHGSSSSPSISASNPSSRVDSIDWTVPVKYTFFDGMDKLWRHSNLRFSLQTLHNDLHAMRPEKK